MRGEKFAAQHQWDRAFFLGFILVGWAAIFLGFYSSVADRFTGRADYAAPPILVVHVFSFVGWMCLLTMQALLINLKRVDIHKRMGLIGALLIPIMVVSGIGSEIESQRFYSVKDPVNSQFFIMPITTMLMFAILSTAALVKRKDSPSHKRLILLATTVILSAGFLRWWGDAMYTSLGDEFLGTYLRNYLGPDLLIAAAITYDLVTRGRIHRVYVFGTAFIVVIQIAATKLYHSALWPPIARAIAGI
ncbi:MAG: hypothetical protein R3C58_03285 [Parvularculaceae bacterium]